MHTGRGLGAGCGAAMKRLQAEMGGKSPMIVMDDADLPLAVSVCLNGAFFQTGQRCAASTRLIVQKGIHGAFVSELQRKMRALRVGHALDAASQIGPVASQAQLEINMSYIALAKDEGCEVLGGERVVGQTDGYFQRPALFLGASNAMRSSREEIFGPCARVIKVDSYEEAVATANDT